MYNEYSKNVDINNYVSSELFCGEDSFGSMCPTNWQEIAEALKYEIGRRCDEFIEKHGFDALLDYASPVMEFDEICHDVWNDYCDGTLERTIPNFPKTIFED